MGTDEDASIDAVKLRISTRLSTTPTSLLVGEEDSSAKIHAAQTASSPPFCRRGAAVEGRRGRVKWSEAAFLAHESGSPTSKLVGGPIREYQSDQVDNVHVGYKTLLST
jgi:hypothetical protein